MRPVRESLCISLESFAPTSAHQLMGSLSQRWPERFLIWLARFDRMTSPGRLEQAERLRLFDLDALDALMARNPRRPGVGKLKQALLAYRDRPHHTRSELERRFLDLCRDAGFPTPAVNIWLAGQEVDMVWPDQRLVVELDGRSYHETRAAFERDRVRDTALQLAGYRVVRVTQRRLDAEPEVVIATIRSLLSAAVV